MSSSPFAETEGLEQGEIYRCLFEESDQAIMIVDPASAQILDLNQASLRLIGDSREQLVGQSLSDVVTAEGVLTIERLLETTFTPNVFHSTDMFFIESNGRATRVELDIHPLRSKASMLALVVARDKSERQLYRRAIAAANSVVYQIDFESDTYTYMGDRMEQILGFPVEQLTPSFAASRVRQHIMRGDASHLGHVDAATQFRSGKLRKWSCDEEWETSDGRLVWLSDSSVLVSDENGKPTGCLGILRDITARKTTKADLGRFFAQPLNLMAIVRFDGIVQEVNPACEALLGFERDEFLGHSELELIHPDDHERMILELEQLKQGKTTTGFQLKMVCKDGSTRQVIWSGLPDVEQGLFFATGKDITERSQNEQLLQIQSRLLERIAIGEQLQDIFDELCQHVESFVPGAVCTFMELDELNKCLNVCAAPSLGDETIAMFNGLQPGQHAGACGTAAFTGETTIVEDTETDPRWATLLDVAKKAGIRACWSIPVNHDGRVVATFAISHDQPRRPDTFHERLLTWAAHIAGVAIQRSRTVAALERFQAILDQAGDAIYVIDPDSARFLDANLSGLRDLTCTREELLELTVHDVQPPDSDDAPSRWTAKIETLKRWNRPMVRLGHHVRKDGSTFPIEVTESYHVIQGRGYVLAVVRDITVRTKAADQLQAQHRALEQLATGSSLKDILETLIRNIEHQIPGILASVLILDGKRLTHGAAPSLPDEYNELVDGVEIGPNVGSCGTAAYLGKRVVVEDTTNDPRWANFRDVVERFNLRACWSQPILSDSDEVVGTLALYYREKRSPTQAELSLAEASANLAGIAIERRHAEQELKKREAELAHVGRLSTLGVAIAHIAHEINQPLFAISNFAKAAVIEIGKGSASAEDLCTRFRRIDGLATSAGDVLQRIRGFLSKSEADRELVLVNDVIQESLQIIAFEAKRSHIRVETEKPAKDTLIWADAVLVQQVIVNLLKNAFDELANVPSNQRTVRITATVREDVVEIEVRDSGRGFGSAIPDTVFDAFYSTKPEGMGIGLAISKSIVESHGGQIWVTENDGPGATFHATLPVPD